ncbi:glycosyl transferase [Chryseolinea lacunae]|uniref:Glycosyl transferase n=1 Tax=Chryseolinea lacunae TaxID=2801331 RepID=A0ABS1KQ69_9BACT|nr:glycosyl transferase [Chryseolinea lacunae]MBL0741343.1 glycosyl transferase [Chryseolinea lacunae]
MSSKILRHRMKENKVLIVTYYWPPSGGSGVQRWLKFVKYLPGLGWTPYVFTPENPAFDIRDESLARNVPPEARVIRFPIWEPYEAFFAISSLLGKKKSARPTDLVSGKNKSLFQTLSTWVRGNLIVPDPRVFWVKPSVKFLDTFLKEQNITTIITTGPPHSMHLIGYRLKKKNPTLRWIADFRDPWSEWGLLESLMVGKRALRQHQQWEARVLQTADAVTTITPFYVRRFEALAKRPVTLLTNGYDEDDFATLVIRRPDTFVIRHVGIVNEKCDPRPFMRAVEALATTHPEFGRLVQIDFVGEVHPQFRAFVMASTILAGITTFTASVPHRELIAKYGDAALLLLVLTGYKDAEGYMPGKLFEYLATGLPILATGPEAGDAAQLLNKTNAGRMIDGDKQAVIIETLAHHFEHWKQGTAQTKKHAGEEYSRRAIARKLTEML